MINVKYFIIIIFLFSASCNKISFTYNNNTNLTNPIYNKTEVFISGKDIPSLYRYVSSYIGRNKSPAYQLEISIEEEKIKRSVQTNQAVSKLDYELKFVYILKKNNSCKLYEKTIFSGFSYVPKSEGYNFGSDESLEKMYELSSKENIEMFINSISELNLETCNNEA